MKMKVFLASMAALALASTAHAATITYTLLKDVNSSGATVAGAYTVYASVNTGDNSGLAGFNFSLAGVNTTVNNLSPQVIYNNSDPEAQPPSIARGFTLTRLNGTASTAAAQDTPSYLTNITNGAAQSIQLKYGMGQTSGDLSTSPPAGFTTGTSTRPTYAASVLLASGTYVVGGSPLLTVGSGNVFNNAQDGTTQAALVNLVNPGPVPEPASLALLGLGGVSLLARRRKAVTA